MLDGEVVRLDLGLGRGIGGGRLDVARALRPELRDAQRHARHAIEFRRAVAAGHVACRREVELHVGRREARPRLEVAAGMAGRRRQQALAREGIAQNLAHQPQAAALLVQRARALDQRRDAHGVVVAEVAADARQGMLHRHADLAQIVGIADARDLQELRRVDGAATQDHVAAGADLLRLAALSIGDADGLPALEVDALDQRVGDHLEVRPAHRGPQIGVDRAPAPAALHHVLVEQRAFLVAAVVVGRALEPERLVGVHEGVAQHMRVALVLDEERARAAARLVAAASAAFGALEVGQQVVHDQPRQPSCAQVS